ncbi:MAG: DMT family transporter [Bacteroidetes bacterium]|nr:DMT family transporter [Bacteroidota bacterium]MCW5896146.1 DMT family transporter [Bacteroidota bacterium]
MISIRLLLLFCVLIWGWTFVATKMCLAYLDPYELVGLRFGIGLPVLFFVIRLKRLRIEFSRREYRPLAVGAVVIGVHFLIQAVALNYTSATNTGWIIAATPLALAGLSFLILKERIGQKEIAGIAVATLGIIILISRGDFTSLGWLTSIGDWLILASAHTWALYTISTRDISRIRNPLTVTLCVFVPVTVVCLFYILAVKDISTIMVLPADVLVALLFLGVLGTLAQWFWQIGIARIGATRAGIFLYLEPIATTMLAIPLLNESFTFSTACGGLLVMTAVWWAQRK